MQSYCGIFPPSSYLTYLHNYIHHPIVSFSVAEVHHGAVAVASPDGTVGIFHQVALLGSLLEVVVMVGCPSLRYIAEHAIDIRQCLDTLA